MTPDGRRGFTLLEMLVALAVFGLAAAALLRLSAENTRLSAHLESRAIAGMVAENLAVEATTAPQPPTDADGMTAMAGRDWRWSRAVSPVGEGALLRIDIAVAEAEAAPGRSRTVLTVFRGGAEGG